MSFVLGAETQFQGRPQGEVRWNALDFASGHAPGQTAPGRDQKSILLYGSLVSQSFAETSRDIYEVQHPVLEQIKLSPA